MSSYLRQTNYEPLRVPLYQPDFGMISRVSLIQQSRYDRGVQSIANTYNESLGLSQNLSPYNQQKLNGYMDNATQQLKKMSTLDFSKANNVAQASNLFSPIYKDKSLMFEHQAHSFGEEQLQAGVTMRDSKDKDQRDGYSDINMEYVNTPLSKLSGAKTEEEVYKSGSEVMNRYYLPYQNTVAKLDKAAKDAGLDYSVSYVNGAYIVTNKFGAPAYPSMKEFAQMNIDANDIKQLEINSTVGIERMQRDLESKGVPVTNEAIAGNIMENYRGNLNDGIQQQQKVVNALQARFNQLEGMKQNGALNDVGDNSPYKQYIQLGQQLDEAKKGLSDSQDEYKKYSDPSSDEYRKMYGDYVANPVDGAFKMAYGNLTDGWAKTWSDGHVDSSLKMDDVWAKTQDILMRQLELSLKDIKDAKDAKKPEPTEAEKKLAIANTPVPLGQSPDFNSSSVLSGTMYNVINKAEQNSKDLIKEHSYDYMDYMIQKNWNIYTPGTGKHTWLVENVTKRVTDPNKINAPIDNDVRDELSKSPMFKGVDLSKMSYLDLYKRLANESGQYVQHGFDIGDPDANALISGKHSMAVEQANIDHIEQLRKDPNSILSQMDKYKDFQATDGNVLDKDGYVRGRATKDGYKLVTPSINANSSTALSELGGSTASADKYFTKGGKSYSYSDITDKYSPDYNAGIQKFNDLEQSLKRDPAMEKLAFEANFPSYGFFASHDLDNEVAERIFNQVVTDENMNALSIKNLDVLADASNLDKDKVVKMLKEFGNAAKGDYQVKIVDYSPDGRTPYKFIFGQTAIDNFASKDKQSKKGAMSFKDEYQDLATAIKQNGLEIAYGGKTSADTYRENSLDRAVKVLGNYSFDIDSQGKFGYSIRRINKGDNVNEITLHYKSAVDPSTNQYSRNPDGSFQFQDRKQTIEVGAMTPDEAGNMALTTLIELNGRYQNDLNQKR